MHEAEAMKGHLLTTLTVVVDHDFATETGVAFAVVGSQDGGAASKRPTQEQLDALAAWIEGVSGE